MIFLNWSGQHCYKAKPFVFLLLTMNSDYFSSSWNCDDCFSAFYKKRKNRGKNSVLANNLCTTQHNASWITDLALNVESPWTCLGLQQKLPFLEGLTFDGRPPVTLCNPVWSWKSAIRYFLSRFRFKYYPENVADEIIQDNTLRLLFLQVNYHG